MAFEILERFCVTQDFFELNLKYLFLVGLWPNENWSKKQSILYKIYQNTLHCFSIIFLVITGVKTYQIKHDIITFLANIDKSIVAYNYFFKVILFLKRRKEVKKLTDDIFLSGDKIKVDSKDRMINHLVLVTVFNSGLMLVFSMLGLYNGDMTIEAWMPFDAKKNKMNLALSAQILAVIFCIPFSYRAIGMQGIVCSVLIYLCDQLENLQNAVKEFEFSKTNKGECRENFRKIVKKHIRLMRYATSMETMFNEYFLIQNLAVTMELCLNAMMVTMVGTAQKTLLAGFIAFLGLALLNAYIYCKLGNELMDQSVGVAFAAYSSNWTAWPLDLQKDVLLIIRASQRPFQMSAGGIAAISMQTYGTALYNGYSIFAVLNDVVEN